MKKASAFMLSLAIMLVMGAALVSAQSAGGGGGGFGGGGEGTNTPGGGGEGTNNPGGGSEGSNKPITLNVGLENPFKGNGDAFSVLTSIIDNILMPIGGVLAVMGFIWAGFLFVTSGGKKGQLDDARKALTYTAIGTIILFGSRAIAEVIKNTILQLR